MSHEEPRRPDPEALLAAVKKTGRGRLKVFLGMAPGVGKTYEMLSEARRRQVDGLDVVVGVVETHGRKETEALCEGLELLSRRPLDHRGRTLLEFDLDAALARSPKYRPGVSRSTSNGGSSRVKASRLSSLPASTTFLPSSPLHPARS